MSLLEVGLAVMGGRGGKEGGGGGMEVGRWGGGDRERRKRRGQEEEGGGGVCVCGGGGGGGMHECTQGCTGVHGCMGVGRCAWVHPALYAGIHGVRTQTCMVYVPVHMKYIDGKMGADYSAIKCIKILLLHKTRAM